MHVIETSDDLLIALAESYNNPILILKISNICPISERLYEKFKERVGLNKGVSERIYILVVQEARDTSKEIALRFGIVHETPQALLIKNEEVLYYENHESIDLEKIIRFLISKEF